MSIRYTQVYPHSIDKLAQKLDNIGKYINRAIALQNLNKMKTTRTLPLLGLLIRAFFASCKKHIATPKDDDKTSASPKCEITLSNTHVLSGESTDITFDYKGDGKVTSISLENVNRGFPVNTENTRTFNSGVLLVSTVVHVMTDKNENFSKTITVSEDSANISRNNMLTSKPWKLTELAAFYLNGEVFMQNPPDPSEANDQFHYYANHNKERIRGGSIIGTEYWVIKGDYILWDGVGDYLRSKDSIGVLSDDTMVLWRKNSTTSGVPIWNRLSFAH